MTIKIQILTSLKIKLKSKSTRYLENEYRSIIRDNSARWAISIQLVITDQFL